MHSLMRNQLIFAQHDFLYSQTIITRNTLGDVAIMSLNDNTITAFAVGMKLMGPIMTEEETEGTVLCTKNDKLYIVTVNLK